jgi:hypothetical protein
MRRRVAEFEAQYADGTTETIIVYQDFIDASDLDGASTIPGGKMLKTASGMHVNRVGTGKYELVNHARTPLTSDEPNAL